MRELYDKETNFRTFGSADEFGAPPRESDCDIVREISYPAEDHVSAEERSYKSEYNESALFKSDYSSEDKMPRRRHEILKRVLLKPLVSFTLLVSLAYTALGVDFLGEDQLNSAWTTMNSEWLENHPEDWGAEPHGHWDEPWDEPLDEGFPMLENLYPDYAGFHAGDRYGPEQYVRFSFEGESGYKYLVKGAAWDVLDPDGALEERLDGAYYDSAANTLTLENFDCALLDVNLMGNGFTIRVLGECRVEYIMIWGFGYGGSVTFEGDGVLNSNGAVLIAEGSRSCIMVRSGVTLNFTALSSDGALQVNDTQLDVPLYLAPGVNISGGSMKEESSGEYETNNGERFTVRTFASYGDDGEPARQIVISGG